eukprot:TRINITY_DN15804_c0_g1_i1.p1 TRINITY_DN15804_c0_g1~~TRINITY_DN15804_c0_g1_i1.p1  ORF type:complete len:151 (-),score=46.87 TRINITY_DN15804_c0_g1_i1:95-547(-)
MGDFSAEQMVEIKEAFQLFDKDADGKITIDELGTVMRALGQNPTQSQVKELAKEVVGGASLVDFNNFLSILQRRVNSNEGDEQHIREAFKVFDKNGTGLIEIADLKHVLTTIGEKLSPQEVDGVMKEADTDGDGKINLQDFLRVMKSAKA